MRRLIKITAALFLAGLLLPATTALAADVFWNAISGNVSDPTNWSTENVPTVGDIAYIANGGEAAISAGNTFAGANILGLRLGNLVTDETGAHGYSGKVTQTGGSVVMGGTNPVVYIGYKDNLSGTTSLYDMQGGTLTSIYMVVIGYGAGASGKLKMSGGDSTTLGAYLTTSSRIFIGDTNGSGAVEMSGYSKLESTNNSLYLGRGSSSVSGTLSMTDHANLTIASSTTYIGGSAGHGTMTMDGNSTAVINSATTYIGQAADAVGELTLKGQSQMTVNNSSFFRVGSTGGAPTDDGEGNLTYHNAKGTINIQGGTAEMPTGAKLSAMNGLNVGIYAYGEGHLNVHEYGELYLPTGKTLVLGDMYQTAEAHGNLLVDGHGKVTTDYLSLGQFDFGRGHATLKDYATLACTGDAYIGWKSGIGELTTTDADDVQMSVGGTLYVGYNRNGAGARAVGSMTIADGAAVNAGSALFGSDYGNATVTMTGGSITTVGLFAVGRGSNSSGSLTMSGDASIASTGSWIAAGNVFGGVTDGGAMGGTISMRDTTTLTAAGDILVGWGGTGTLTVGDGSADDNAVATAGTGVLLGHGTTLLDTYATVNLNRGGTLQTSKIYTTNSVVTVEDVSTYYYAQSSILNLNGGLLKATADDTTETPFIKNSGAALLFQINILEHGANIDTNGHNVTIDEALIEDSVSTGGGLTKLGEGILTLAKACSYTGDTSVEAGALAVNGSITSDVTVAADAALMGNGAVTGHVTAAAGSSVAPGNSIGTLTVTGDLTLSGTLDVEYDGDTSTIDMLAVSGELDLSGGTLSFSNWGTQPLANGDYVFATYGTLTGAPATEVGLLPGWYVDYAYDYNGGADNSIALIAVPEPSTFALVAVLFGWLAARRRGR